MATQKKILLGKKDALLKLWLIKYKQQESSCTLSATIRQAILYYIQNHTFMCIGKIHQDMTIELPKQMAMQLPLTKTSHIEEWLNSLKSNGLNTSEYIRDILKNSISIVSDAQEEWFPSYLELDMMAHNHPLKEPLTKTTKALPSSETIPDTAKSISGTITAPEIKNPEALQEEHKEEKKKTPSCVSMFSDDDW